MRNDYGILFYLLKVHQNNISKVLNFFFHNYVDLLKPAQRFLGQNLAKMRKLKIKKKYSVALYSYFFWKKLPIFEKNNFNYVQRPRNLAMKSGALKNWKEKTWWLFSKFLTTGQHSEVSTACVIIRVFFFLSLLWYKTFC